MGVDLLVSKYKSDLDVNLNAMIAACERAQNRMNERVSAAADNGEPYKNQIGSDDFDPRSLKTDGDALLASSLEMPGGGGIDSVDLFPEVSNSLDTSSGAAKDLPRPLD